MKTKLFKISLIVLMFLGLVIAGVFLTQAENQVSANDSTTIQEPLPEPAPLKFSIPGRIERTGTYFEIEDSEYINITLKSTEKVKVALESIPRMISINLESSSTSSSTIFTLEGLEPNKTYYRYQNSYRNGAVLVSDENGSYIWSQDLTRPHHVWFQETKGTVFISENAILSLDLTESVEITANNITLDCAGHNIIGTSTGYGIYLNNKTGVTIKNCHISNFTAGIGVFYSSKIILNENNLNFSYYGLQGFGYPSSEIKITQNNLSNNSWNGLVFSGDEIDNSKISSNEISNNGFGGIHISGFSNTIQGNNISNNGTVGLRLYDMYNQIIGNNITSNGEYGILFEYAWQNTISENNVANNNKYGIRFYCSGSNTAFLNNFINHQQNHNWTTWEGCGTPPPNVLNSPEKLNYTYQNLNFNNYLGNHWSDYIGFDINNDGIGDIAYSWGLDNYPLIQPIENYEIWEAPVNQPPTISGIDQFKSDSIVSIGEGDITTESTVVFKATLNDSNNDQVKLQIELRQIDEPFTGIDDGGILNSDFVDSGNEAIITNGELPEGQYKWRARAIDSRGSASGWQEFGIAGNMDFEVSLPLSTKAAMLAKELVNTLYLYGGKGWDYNLSKFVAANTIKTGYTFWNQKMGSLDFDAGVDCSGLVMWAYDRSFNPNKPRFENFVKAEGADEQYRYNTTSTTESELQPGDVMFFDFDQNNFIDHVAMYVGESGGYDVVNARSRELGIRGMSKNILRELPGFAAFKRVVSALLPAVLVSANSPVDLIVTDPDDFTITPETIVPSELEFLRQIPGVLYYSEIEKGADGRPIDQVYSYTAKTGDYIIKVISETGTLPTGIYALNFMVNGQTMVLADEIPISQIPAEGYGIEITETGIMTVFVPVAIDIKPNSYPNSINLDSKGVISVAIFSSKTFDVKQIDPTTITFANAPIKLKNNGQPMISYEDINGDSFSDAVIQISTQAMNLTQNDTKAHLEGKLFNETLIKGADSVRIISNSKSQKQVLLAFISGSIRFFQQIKTFFKELALIPLRIMDFLTNYFNKPGPDNMSQSEQVSAPPAFKTYRNEEWGFKFEYPKDWILRSNTSYSPFSKFDLIGAPSEKEYLIYYPTPPFLINVVTPDFAERQFSDLKNIASKTTVGGVAGLKYEYEEQKLSHITIILPFGQYKMVLGTTKEYLDTFNQILSTFKFIKPSGSVETKTYRNEEWGFEFQYPEDWFFHANTFGGPFTKFNLVGASPEENNLPNPILPSILINIVTPDFAERVDMSFRSFNASTSAIIVASIRGTRYEYEFEGEQKIGIDIPFGEYHILLGARKDYENVFNQILTTFKFF